MELNVKLDKGAYLPERAYKRDAGFDLRIPKTGAQKYILPGNKSLTIDTGVHVQIPEGYVGFLKSKSGLNVKQGITSEGVIDSGYTGSIVVKLYNNSKNIKEFECGDKITQLVIIPVANIDNLKVVYELQNTERGSKGFGSSGN
jgi:dUTP pyrophosphatase